MNLFERLEERTINQIATRLARGWEKQFQDFYKDGLPMTEYTKMFDTVQANSQAMNNLIKNKKYLQVDNTKTKPNFTRLQREVFNMQDNRPKSIPFYAVDLGLFREIDAKTFRNDLDLTKEFTDFAIKYFKVIYQREVFNILFKLNEQEEMKPRFSIFLQKWKVFARYTRILIINFSLPITKEDLRDVIFRPFSIILANLFDNLSENQKNELITFMVQLEKHYGILKN